MLVARLLFNYLINYQLAINSCSTGKNLLNAGVFLPTSLQATERKKLVSQEFLLKNVDQRFCANHFLQLFKVRCNYLVF